MDFKWVDKAPKIARGISWGIPWRRGDLKDINNFKLANRELQSKVMAYWPDGSIKWLKATGIFGKNETLNNSKLAINYNYKPHRNIADECYNGVYINTGSIEAFFPKHSNSSTILEWIKVKDMSILEDLKVVAQYTGSKVYASNTAITVEDNGPLMSVVKVIGDIFYQDKIKHSFELRFRFYKNQSRFEIIHSVTILSKQAIEGIGFSYNLHLHGKPWNRHVKFIDDAVCTEPSQLLLTRQFRYNNNAYVRQVNGELSSFDSTDTKMLIQASKNAIWNNFRIRQLTDNSYTLKKQTATNCSEVKIGTGSHYPGTIYVGGENSGVALSIGEFWKKAPKSINIDNLSKQTSKVTSWIWSPDAEPIDFSHYSNKSHMDSAYEGMDEILSTPCGIANTSRMAIDIFATPASNATLEAISIENEHPAQIVMSPDDYYETQVFGSLWSKKDTSTPNKAFLEKQMEDLRGFYLNEVQQRHWYGYWDYGDIMHTYDSARHNWLYDLGGYAWQNTELMVNIWVWLDFIRTGNSDMYYFAEAMTRHNSEVDVYHTDKYSGLGSRHNVVHWGDAAKELRISMAYLNRYYYYLTGDERIYELIKSVNNIESHAFDNIEPLRAYFDHSKTPDNKVPIRIGTEWTAMAANWLTAWEQTGDDNYKEKILNGFNVVKTTPNRLIAGQIYLFDKNTRTIKYWSIKKVFGFHMMISFGAPQIWIESAELLNDSEWTKTIADLGEFYARSDKEKQNSTNGRLSDANFSWPMFATGLEAYAASLTKNTILAKKAWHNLLEPSISGVPLPISDSKSTANSWTQVTEYPWITTNVVAQWCLNLIMCLSYIDDYLPEKIPGMNGYIPVNINAEQK